MDKIFLVIPEKIGTVAPEIYGVFCEHIGSVIYGGIYSPNAKGEGYIRGFRKKIIDCMKEAKISLIRWPGGCFAESYDWRDGIGPREERPKRINWWTRFDGKYESNEIGTDEFMDFCELCDAKPYLAANITSVPPLTIRDWIDYCNSPAGTTAMAELREKNGHKEPYNVKYWGVGNENFGGGGNMTPEYYAKEYRRFSEIMSNASSGIELIACGPNCEDYAWTRDVIDVMTKVGFPRKNFVVMSGLSVHYYAGNKGDSTDYSIEEWNDFIKKASFMEELIERHWACAVAAEMEDKAKLCIDEWGSWHSHGTPYKPGTDIFRQQMTQRDAVVTALTLNIFNNHCEKIKLAAVAQLVNCLHSLFLTEGDKCICTPAYHVFNMYRTHQNGTAIRSVNDKAQDYSVCASVKDGVMTISAVNLSPTESRTVNFAPLGGEFDGKATVQILGDGDIHAYNTFEEPDRVSPKEYTLDNFDGTLELPAGAIASVQVKIK